MVRKVLVSLVAIVLALSLSGIAMAENVMYTSRDVQVPATVVLPDGEGPFPLVVLAHGHGGSREENIGFGAIAEALKAKGIATIRMDFPGCGESTESFQMNTLTNMKLDVMNAVSYAMETYNIDATKIGLFGYSMGGRIALELLAEGADDFAGIALLAPANSVEDLKAFLGGADQWETLKATAQSAGFVEFTTVYGQKQELSKEWFADLEKVANPAEIAATMFTGPALVIYSTDDTVVSPTVSAAVAETLKAEVVDATGDGHSYGFYSDKTTVLDAVTNGVADFFAKTLQ